MLEPHTIALHVYAENKDEAKALENSLLAFVKSKYDQGVYVRAASLEKLLKAYGDNYIINLYIK